MEKQTTAFSFNWVDFANYLMKEYTKNNEFLYDSFYHDFFLTVRNILDGDDKQIAYSLKTEFNLILSTMFDRDERQRTLARRGLTSAEISKDLVLANIRVKHWERMDNLYLLLNVSGSFASHISTTIHNYYQTLCRS